MKQVIVGGYNDALNFATTTAEYNCLMGGAPWNTTENLAYQVMPTAGTLGRLFVELSADPTNANSSYTFTVLVDGVASAIVVVIAAGATTGSYTGAAVDVVAGQTVSLRCVATATDPASAIARWTIQFIGTTAGESICLAVFPTWNTVDRYSPIQRGGQSSTENQNQVPMPTPGTFKKLYIQLSEKPGTGTGDAYTIALRVGGSSKNNTVTITQPATSGNITNVTDVVAAGNLVNFIISPVSTPSASPICAVGIVFVSNTDGESLIIGGSQNATSQANTVYLNLGGAEDWTTTETSMYSLIQACTIRNLYVSLAAAPGAGNSYDISINKDGGAASGLTVHIHETDKVGNDTAHTYDPADGDTADIKCVPTSTPDTTRVHIGLVAYIAVPIVYDETGKLQVILAAQGETETVARLETAREQVILAAVGEADGWLYVETGKEQTILAVLGESDIQAMVETGKLQIVLAIPGEADIQTMQELGKLQVILSVLTSADIQTMSETAREQLILAVLGESESLTLDETARLQVLEAVVGESENLTLDEIGKLQVILGVLTSADIQIMQELGITQVVLAILASADAQTMSELGKLQELRAVVGEAETLALDETAREQIIKVILESADIQAMVESLEQLILAVVGKKEGRLLTSSRTTSPTRVLDAIREEGVERVLDSEIVT